MRLKEGSYGDRSLTKKSNCLQSIFYVQTWIFRLFNPLNGRMQLRPLNRQNSFVLAGLKIVFKKIYLQQFKHIFQNELHALLKNNSSKINKKHQIIQQQQINNLKMEIQQINDQFQDVEMVFVDIKREQIQEKLIEILSDQAIELQENQTEEMIFRRFCLPECEFVLWPGVVYDNVFGSSLDFEDVIKSQKYFFNEKEQLHCFQLILRYGLACQTNHSSLSHLKHQETSFTNSKQFELIASKLKQQVDKIQNSRVNWMNSQNLLNHNKNYIIYLAGCNKFILQKLDNNIIEWQQFYDQSLLQNYIKKSYFYRSFEELQFSIQKLNDFRRTETQACRPDDIRLSIDRIGKCVINQKQHICLPLRYSHIQKKILVLVFEDFINVKNNLLWLNLENVSSNFTMPQIINKHKILLYFTNLQIQKSPNLNLKQFIFDLYSNYFWNEFPLQKYLNNFFLIQTDIPITSQQKIDHKKQRCIQCIYPLHDLAYFKCFFCSKYCHQECSHKNVNRSIQLNLLGLLADNDEKIQNKSEEKDLKNNIWVCDTCQPCSLCVQPVGSKSIQCLKCKNIFHELCGKLKMNENAAIREKYLCENCIQCQICEKKLKNLDYAFIKNGYQCTSCHKAQQANQICHICKKQGDGRWAQCQRELCGKWIHRYCDNYLQSKNFFCSSSNNNANQLLYFCPFCRIVQRRRLLLKCIQILTIFDEYQYFIMADYEDLLDYKYVINEPMCFRKMTQKCLDGKYDQNTYESMFKDFELLISNAIKYNMPKDQPHYQARLLNILGRFTFNRIKNIIQSSDEEVIAGTLHGTLKERKKEIFKQVYEHYLQMILNFKAEHSMVEVKRPKQKSQKNLTLVNPAMFNSDNQIFIFHSRPILNNFFKSCMLKFKIKNKTPKIQNLFETQKTIDAFKGPIKDNFCFYHYWNSKVIFYCEICMQYYCCVDECFKHKICGFCSVKGCACDQYKCGCAPLREKQRKAYEKTIVDKFYDRRELTENFKLCLRCAFEKLNTKICVYCSKAYEYYYDFQTCRVCKKIYHKQCADIHSSSQMCRFFFKKQNSSPQEQLFSQSLRLSSTCYECSTSSKNNKQLMYEKLKAESMSRLLKLQKLVKYQYLLWGILIEKGIKISLGEMANLVFGNYEEFLRLEGLMEQYLVNYMCVKVKVKQGAFYTEKVNKTARELIGMVNTDDQERMRIPPLASILQLQKDQASSMKIKDPSKSHISSYCSLLASQVHLVLPQINPCFQLTIIKYSRLSLSSNLNERIYVQILLKWFQLLNLRYRLRRCMQLSMQGLILTINNSFNGLLYVNNNKSKQNEKLLSLSKANNINNPTNLCNNNGNKKQLTRILFNFPIINLLLDCSSFMQLKINVIDKMIKQSQNSHQKVICMLVFDLGYVTKDKDRLKWLVEGKIMEIGNWEIIKEKGEIIIEKEEQEQLKKSAKCNNVNSENDVALNIQQEQQSLSMQQQQQQYQSHANESTSPSHLLGCGQFSSQFSLMSNYISCTKTSQISSYQRMLILDQIISKYILETFQASKHVYRRGSTLILKNQVGNWRVLKKGKNMDHMHDISLRKEKNGKWLFSINQHTWWIQTIEQIISKLRSLAEIHSFRQLADFLGFTFKLVPLQSPNHFTRFLQTHPLDEIDRHAKKNMILQVYDRYEWQRNGVFEKKKSYDNQDLKQYTVIRKKPFYLKKRNANNENEILQKKYSSPPYITFEDLKKDLQYQSLNLQYNKNVRVVQYQQQQQQQSGKDKIDNVFIAPSPIHKLGLFAKKYCPAGTIMVQYIGEIVSESLADVRESKFHFGCYMFGLNRRNLDKKEIIDATYRGNMARYLNHSCDANCKARIQVIEDKPRIFIYSIRDIAQYEELTYDYQFSVDANDKLICTCGASNCQGRLN